jgi:hypothetical protein
MRYPTIPLALRCVTYMPLPLAHWSIEMMASARGEKAAARGRECKGKGGGGRGETGCEGREMM